MSNLPPPITGAIKSSDFVPVNNGFSASMLSNPVQMYYLKKKSGIKDEVSDSIWMLIRNGMMQIIENNSETLKVYRGAQAVYNAMKSKLPVLKMDSANDGKVQDLTAAMKTIASFTKEFYPTDKEEWILKQTYSREVEVEFKDESGKSVIDKRHIFDTIHMFHKPTGVLYLLEMSYAKEYMDAKARVHLDTKASVQAYILGGDGFEVKEAHAVMIFKNWTFHASTAKSGGYPRKPVEVCKLNLLNVETVEKVIRERMSKYILAEKGYISPCSAKDRWKEADDYVIRRKNGKIADGARMGFISAEAAQEKIDTNMYLYAGCYVDIKVGRSRRCESYCKVNHICEQWRELKPKEIPSEARIAEDLNDI
jgi:hypothetical protein